MKEDILKELKNNNEKEIQYDILMDYLDPIISKHLRKIPNDIKKVVEEIRLRIDKPLIINMNGIDYFICEDGKLSNSYLDSLIISKENINKSFQLICNYSIYAVEEELRNGFITIRGGHRVGVAGKGLYCKNDLLTIKDISSLNIRISKEKLGVSKKILPFLIKDKNIFNTLIISPPQCGKTTLLRDIIRNLSNGIPKYNFKGMKIGIVDERSEIAGVYKGTPQNDVGIRTDVLDSLKKHEGISLLIRSMSPQVIATDELGGKKDIDAIHEALKAGVKLISTVHGESIKDITSKPYLKELINEKIFERFIILDNSMGVGTISDIVDGYEYKSLLK